MPRIFHFIYKSQSINEFTDAELKELLKRAQSHNEKAGITGALVYRQGIFLQLIEGDKDKVLSLYSKIHQDKRHQLVCPLVEFEDDERIFPNWSMAHVKEDQYQSQAEEILDLYEGFISQKDATEAKTIAKSLFKMFSRSFQKKG